MGRISVHRSPRVDLLQLKALAFILLILCGPSWAGSASAVIGGGAVKSGSSWTVKGPSATAANGAFITPATVTAAGKQITIPATATIAANAASFAVSAVRLNPAALVVGLTAQWLLGQGLQWASNEWQKNIPSHYEYGFDDNGAAVVNIWFVTRDAASCALYRPYAQASYSSNLTAAATTYTIFTTGGALGHGYCRLSAPGVNLTVSFKRKFVGDQNAPAVEADFTAAASQPVPDNVVQELSRAGVAFPVSDPVLNSTTPIVENYGTPFVDPVTGKTVQTKTRITPDPLPADPYNVRIESYNVEVSPAPEPVPGEPVPLPKDEQPTDPCIDNPDRVGCLNSGTPEDTELGTYTPPFTVTPVTIGGAGNCPPDPVMTVKGTAVTLKFGPICDAAGWLRPLVLALAFFGAALIVGGAVRES